MASHVKEQADDDRGLMLSFQTKGDERAFDRLFIRHKGPLVSFLNRFVQDPARAEEISQSVWLKVIETAGRGMYIADPNANFRTWLFTLARNAALDDIRKNQRLEVMPEVPEPDDQYDAHDPAMTWVESSQIVQWLLTALRLLPPEQREVLALWSTGVPFEDIAVITGAPLDTVIGRKRYAFNRLRAQLKHAGFNAELGT